MLTLWVIKSLAHCEFVTTWKAHVMPMLSSKGVGREYNVGIMKEGIVEVLGFKVIEDVSEKVIE